jgi:hypothetical protein
MIDLFSTAVALLTFCGSVFFIYLGWFMSEYNDYSFQINQYDWLIKYANKIGDEAERKKNEFLKTEFKTKYRHSKNLFLIICSIISITFFIIILLISFALPVFAQIPSINENSTNANQNITYIVNNYYNNYTIEQITVKNENRPFSFEKLKYLMQNGKNAKKVKCANVGI